jgi:hypothetical protein
VFFDQLDLLSKTMGIMEERLTLTESRVSSMIASQRTAAYQQQRAHIEHSDVADVAPAHAPATASTHATSGSASSATAAPSVSDLRTIQLRVMCRQYGLDATGTEAELLQRLNDSVATRAGIAAPGNATSFAAASDMNDSLENSVEQDETKGQSESEASYEAFDSEGETGEAGIDVYAEENFQVIVWCVLFCCSGVEATCVLRYVLSCGAAALCLVLVSQSQIVPVLQHGHHTITQAVYADTHGTFAYEEYDYAGSEDETDEVVVEEEEAEEGEPVVVGGYDSDEVDYEE